MIRSDGDDGRVGVKVVDLEVDLLELGQIKAPLHHFLCVELKRGQCNAFRTALWVT